MRIVLVLFLVRCIDHVIDVKTIKSGWPLNTGLTVMMRRFCFKTQLFPSFTVPVFVCLYDCPVFKARTQKHHRDRRSSTILDGLKPCESEIASFSQPWAGGGGGGGGGVGGGFWIGSKFSVCFVQDCSPSYSLLLWLIDWLNDSC